MPQLMMSLTNVSGFSAQCRISFVAGSCTRQPYLSASSWNTRLPSTVHAPGWRRWKCIISVSGNEQQISQWSTNRLAGLPCRISSLKKRSPPAVPSALLSRRYRICTLKRFAMASKKRVKSPSSYEPIMRISSSPGTRAHASTWK
ncbi:hypothetical protein PybrP1_005366 [[Pythium] brassicae (nom. inval.)]|nr:hypothetical protein PybrP1_005366 [[Pythium] brassicae (nom. inval.)]